MKENRGDSLSTEFKCTKIVITMTLTSCSPSPFRIKKKVSHFSESLVFNSKMTFLKIYVIDTETLYLYIPTNS